MFQSAPGREAGRYTSADVAVVYLTEFQSAPGREAGRYGAAYDLPPAPDGFNPRPAVRPGDTKEVPVYVPAEAVSIRARP